MSYFTGMILPGVTMPWLIMNSLIDCDVDAGVNALQALTYVYIYTDTLLYLANLSQAICTPTLAFNTAARPTGQPPA